MKNRRLRLIGVSGTVAVFQCPAGHRITHDYGRGPVSRRIPAESLAFLTRRAWHDGLYGHCPHCDRGPRRVG